jgi:hypothetical protein
MTACTHPPDKRQPGPRVPRVYGSGPTEVCACGAWRPLWYAAAPWGPAAELAEAMEPDENR